MNARIGSAVVASVVAAGTVMTVVPAHAGGRPVGVAHVRARHHVRLHHDGSVTVRERLKCDPAWQPAELDIHVVQGYSYGDGYLIPDVACDNEWHPAHLRISDIFGTLRTGAARVDSQFLVTNLDSGDSAAGHQQADVTIVRYHHPYA